MSPTTIHPPQPGRARRRPWVLLVLCLGGAVLPPAAANEPERTPTFERDVRPILKATCFHCHGEGDQREGGLDVRLARLLTTGGESGPAIVPGDSAGSLLYQRVRDGEMPPDPTHRLSETQVEAIRRWIDAGAATARPEPESPDALVFTEEERSHWAFQPLVKPPLPPVRDRSRLRSPVDAFILSRLEAEGASFAADAPRPTLLRRLKLDLLGLPPEMGELEEFMQDNAPDAYDRLVERYLASPHYGERWGRHWLDVAGYADSDGYSVEDLPREHAWRYRDYVVRAFNTDLPFDRFIMEQLAGDELITSPVDNLSPQDAELLAATGFLRMAPDGTGGTVDDPVVARNEVVADTIRIVTSALLGLTVGCAQCHDHRYDPIPQTDYYRLRAVFEPAFHVQKWRKPRERLISLYTEADRAQAAVVEAEAKLVEEERTRRQAEFIAATFEKELAKLPEELREPARAARDTPEKERTPEQKQLLKQYPSLNVSAGSLYLYDQKAADELKQLADRANEIRSRKPAEEFVHALREVPGEQPETFLFHRGDPTQPRQACSPGGLSILEAVADLPDIPADHPNLSTTGRRLAFAQWLTHRRHPLTARVIVNRVWMHHFGRGLVATPADFGVLGSPPTHPELLDWLAVEFIESGWSLKHLHRLILSSTTFRQGLRSDPALIAADPDNLLYGGANLRRLDAETLRDSVLAVSGRLNPELFGPPVPVMADHVGRWVLGIENLDAGRPGKVIPLGGAEYRRSLYVQVRRSRPLAVLDAFDWPRMTPNCEARRASTVAPQSLLLLNSDFTLASAEQFARRVEREAGPEPAAQIVRAWQLAYGRTPDDSERASALAFLEDQTDLFRAAAAGEGEPPPSKPADTPPPPTPAQRSLETLCQMLLGSNEFLYVD